MVYVRADQVQENEAGDHGGQDAHHQDDQVQHGGYAVEERFLFPGGGKGDKALYAGKLLPQGIGIIRLPEQQERIGRGRFPEGLLREGFAAEYIDPDVVFEDPGDFCFMQV